MPTHVTTDEADLVVASPSRRTLGTGAQQAMPGNDTRIASHPHAKITVANVAPASPAVGDIWVDSA